MCKNADKPFLGCKKNKKFEAEWMFFTDEERMAIETSKKTPPLVEAHA